MADRDLMALHDLDADERMDGTVETVRGAGQVGIIAASIEARQQRILVAAPEQGLAVVAHPGAAPVSREEAAHGMQNLEQRAAQAIAGTAAQTAQALNVLAGQAATAVQQTAESSQRAVTELEGQTREAFGRTETAMSTMHQGMTSQADRLAQLEAALLQEKKMRATQKAMIERLSKDLADATAKVERLSADLAVERSIKDVQPPVVAQNHPPAIAQAEQVIWVQPPQFQQGVEIAAIGDDARNRTPPPARLADHPGRPTSRVPPTREQRSPRPASRHSRAGSMAVSSHGGDPIMSGFFDVQIKPKDPPTFSGRTNDDPEVWVGQVSNFFRLVGGPPWKQVAYASTLLQGTAQTWWQRQVKKWEDPKDWQTFAEQLIGRFKNTNKADSAMAALMNIKQRKEESTHDFICRFEAELDKVDSYDEAWVLKMFIWGLPQDQAVLVSQGKPRKLSQAFQLARDAALAAQMSRRPGTSGRVEGSSGQKGQGRGHGRSQGQSSGQGQTSAPNVVYYQAQNKNVQQGGNRGRGQAGRPPVPPQATVVVRQPVPQQPAGSGQRGRGRGNQRKPRAAAIAAQDDQGTAGPSGQVAAQYAAGTGTDASLNQGQGN